MNARWLWGSAMVRRSSFTPVILAMLGGCLGAAKGAGQETVVFEGFPTKRVESSLARVVETALSPDEGLRNQIRIVTRDGRYFWATNEMKELSRSGGTGTYITYHAVDGSGYVRVYVPVVLSRIRQFGLMSEDPEPEYVEHIMDGFASTTFYGTETTVP